MSQQFHCYTRAFQLQFSVSRSERATECFAQSAGTQRLVEDLDDSRAQRTHVRLSLAMAGDEQDRDVRAQFVNHSRERRAVEDRHALVREPVSYTHLRA